MNPKFPNITVKLTGTDGNAFAILGKMRSVMRSGGVPKDQLDTFLNEAMSGDYNHLLATCCEWVNVR